MELFYKKKIFLLFLIIFPAFAVRFFVFKIYGDTYLANEWGYLFNNFKNYGVIGYYVFDGNITDYKVAGPGNQILPSAYMPPFYLFVLIFLNFFIENENLLINFLFFFQIFLSICSSYFLFRILKNFFRENIYYFGVILFLYYPTFIFASTQVSSITFHVFFFNIFLYLTCKLIKTSKIKIFIFYSVIAAILLLLRGEFILILFFSYFFIFLKTKKTKQILISFLVTLILISPYLIRNYKHFDQVFIIKSVGYNLWKGNNLFSTVEGNEQIYQKEMLDDLNNIKPDNLYELNRDDIFKFYAINNIKSDYLKYAKLYFKKFFSFIFFNHDSSYPRYYSLYYFLPKILLSSFSIIGFFIICFKQKKLLFFNFLFLIYAITISVFFILPRYDLIIFPLQILLSCSVFSLLKLKKFIN